MGNNIPLTAAPEEQFGRTMRIPDLDARGVVPPVAQRPVPAGDPMEAKLELARFIVTRSHGDEAARKAEEHFTRVVREGKTPERGDPPEVALPDAGIRCIVPWLAGRDFRHLDERSRGACTSAQGGARWTARAVAELDLPRERLEHAVLQAGKRPFRPLDTRLTAAIILRLPEKGGMENVPDQEYPTERSEDGSRR